MESNAPELDAAQREAVECDLNAVVTAGAGSGKTTVLAERYVRLIRQGKATVDAILTLTFTRKAAAEMYERIYSRLVEESENPLVAEQLATFDRAQISTLDSFCAQIAKNWAPTYGIPTDFGIGEAETGALVEECALEFILDHADDPSLAAFIELNGFENVWREFFVRLGTGFIHVAEERSFEQMYEEQIEALEKMEEELIAGARSSLAAIRRIDASAATAIRSAHEMIPSDGEWAEMSREDAVGRICAIRPSKRTGGSASESVVLYKELVDEFARQRNGLEETSATLASRELIRGMLNLCDLFQGELLARKRASGMLSFQDVVEIAVRALIESPEIRAFYKKRYRYIMIDEFQDNNDLQKRLLYLLAERSDRRVSEVPGVDDLEPDKLFFVGDEKQSIYAFRGADVSVFKRLEEEIEQAGGRTIRLAKNYRSHPAIVDFVNETFPLIMENPSESYEARFAPTTAGRVNGRGAGSAESSIRLFYGGYDPNPSPGSAHSDDAEAYHIARFIRESVEQGSLRLIDRGGSRSARYEDFALLMRSTSNQIRYERLFRRFGIPYSTQSVRSLFLEAPLNDFYNLLQLVVYPEDRSAYAAFLRSPLVKLSDEGLIRALLASGAPFDATPEGLSDSDARRLDAGAALYRSIAGKADVAPIAELVFDIWYRYGYRYLFLKDAAYHGYLEYYDYFQKMASDADARGEPLALFLDTVRPNLGKYERLLDVTILKDERPGVQLLTIHTAKGLEFPIVILANAGNTGRAASEARAPFYLSKRFGLTLRVTESGNYFYRVGEEEAKRKEAAELKRLLYVAMTRAQSHLVLSGCHNRNNLSREDAPLNLILKGIRWRPDQGAKIAAGGAGVPVEEIPPVREEELGWTHAPREAGNIDAIVAGYRSAATIERALAKNDWTPSEIEDAWWSTSGSEASGAGSDRIGQRPLPSIEADPLIDSLDVETQFGSLCHAVLERTLDPEFQSRNPDWTEHFPIESLPARVLRRIPDEAVAALVGNAASLAKGFLASDLGRRALSDPNRRREEPFLYSLDLDGAAQTVRGSLDLLFDGDDEALLIDFKTDRQRIAGRYDAQLLAYRLAAEALLGKAVRAFLYYLRDGRAVEAGRGDSKRLAEILRAARSVPEPPRDILPELAAEDSVNRMG